MRDVPAQGGTEQCIASDGLSTRFEGPIVVLISFAGGSG